MATIFGQYVAPVIASGLGILGIVYLFLLMFRVGPLVRSIRENPHGIRGPVESEPDDPYNLGSNDEDIL